jgi:hypothetical protein
MYDRYIKLIIIFGSFTWFLMGEDALIKVTQFDDAPELLAHPLPADLLDKPVVHLRTLALQKDQFSCGYHALFNAVAIDQTVQGGYYDFEKKLRTKLADRNLFFEVCSALNGKEISDASAKFSLESRLISLFLNDKAEFMIPCLAVEITHNLNLSKSEIQELLLQKQKVMVREKISQLINDIKNKPYQTAHFICNIGNHWITFSFITNSFGHAKLYVIGAWNEPMNAVMKRYAIELLSYL